MEKISMYSLKVLSALSLTIVLSACGGGSSKSAPVKKDPVPSSSSVSSKSSAKSSVKSSAESSAAVSSATQSSLTVSSLSSSLAASASSIAVSSATREPIPDSSAAAQSSVLSSSSLIASSSIVSSSSSSKSLSSSLASSSLVSSSQSSLSSSSSSLSSSKSSVSSSAVSFKGYNLRGTQTTPAFVAGDLMTPVAGSANDFEICRKFDAVTAPALPRFKVNLDGDWTKPSYPDQDRVVKVGWVKVLFNNKTNLVTVLENQAANCEVASSSVSSSSTSSLSSSVSSVSSSAVSTKGYNLRGTQTTPHFIAGDLMTLVAGSANDFEICRKFDAVTAPALPRFKINLDGDWTKPSFPDQDRVVKVGWVKILFNNKTNVINVQENMAANCGVVSSSSVSSSSKSSLSSSSSSLVSSSSTSSSLLSSSSNSSSTVSSSSNSSSSLASSSSLSSSSEKSSVSSSTSSKSASSNSSVSSSSEVVAHDLRARTAYFVMLDRFADGDTTNNAGVSVTKNNGDVNEWKKYWGGDIDGLISKLPYLKSLGVTAVVVSSMVDNTTLGYHGYWARDFYAVDEHLAKDLSKVKALQDEMQKLDMKLIMEITLNNSSNEVGEAGKLWKATDPVVSDFANGVSNGWYHDNGSIGATEFNDPAAYLTKSVSGRPDFVQGLTTNSVADEYLIGAAKLWVANGVDGFRIHSTKYIEPAFVNRFTKAVRDVKADAYIFGDWPESGDAGLKSSAAFVTERHGSELMDFALRNNIEAAIAGDQTMTALSTAIKARSTTFAGKENLQAIFLDNNDETRTSVVLRAKTTDTTSRGLGKGMSQALAEARQNMGMAMVMTLPGVPVIYYGTEQNTAVFTANAGVVGADPYNREKIDFTITKPAFSLIKTLADLRSQSLAIQVGGYEERWVNSDVLVYQRETADGKDCAVVAINRGATTAIPVKNLCLAPATYTNLLGSDKVTVSNGEANITLSTNEVLVLH